PAMSERSSRGARTPDVGELKRTMSPIVVVDDTSLNGKARSLMVGGEMSRSLSRTSEPKFDYNDDVLESKKGKTQVTCEEEKWQIGECVWQKGDGMGVRIRREFPVFRMIKQNR